MNSADCRSYRRIGAIRQSAVHSHGLDRADFTGDEALAAILDRYPSDLMDVNQYDFDDNGHVRLKAGERGHLNGAELLQAIRSGRIWINLRAIDDQWPELWAAVLDAFGDIASAYPDLHSVKESGQLIISSPSVRVPYHFDASGVVLFHMRGIKRMFVYPSDERHQPELAMENIVARRTTEELPYDLAFEQDAEVFELHPGEALVWPLYAPHRVENVDGLCVSLSMDYQTWESRARTGSLYTHAFLREKGLKPVAVHTLGSLGLAWRWLLSLPLRRMQVLGNRIAEIPRELVLDSTAPNRDLAQAQVTKA